MQQSVFRFSSLFPALIPVLSGVLLCVPSVVRGQGCAVANGDFQRTQLVAAKDLDEPVQLEVDEEDNVYWIERYTGSLKIYSKGVISTAATIPNYMNGTGEAKVNSAGVIGLALDPRFKDNRRIWLNYSPEPKGGPQKLRVSHFTLSSGNKLDLASEVIIYEYETSYNTGRHSAGDLRFAPDGSLFITTGDTFGVEPSDFTTPYQTSLNPKNNNGKILRIRPKPQGGYEVPAGNLFSGSQGNPEIYIMGNRNPYRMSVDPRTGWIYWGEIGSDGPRMEEVNQARGEPGNYGWPAVFGDNEHTPGWNDYIPLQAQLPPLKPALISYNDELDKVYTGPSATKSLGFRGSCIMGGPVYYYDGASASQHKFPPKYHGTLWLYEFDNKWIKTVSFNSTGHVESAADFPTYSWVHMIDMKFSPAGELYVLDYGGTYRINNPNDGLFKIAYNPPNPATCLPRAPELDGKTIGNAPVRLAAAPSVPHGFLRRVDGRVWVDAAAVAAGHAEAAGEVALLSLDGRVLARLPASGLVPITPPAPGLYLVRLTTARGRWVQKALL